MGIVVLHIAAHLTNSLCLCLCLCLCLSLSLSLWCVSFACLFCAWCLETKSARLDEISTYAANNSTDWFASLIYPPGILANVCKSHIELSAIVVGSLAE
jgi:hypothetical protein